MKALTLSSFGASDVLEYIEVPGPILKKGEILVEMKAIGLNFADLMRRNGVYPMRGSIPYINGFEGAGIVKDINNHPTLQVGDRLELGDPLWIMAHSRTITGGDLWNYLTSYEERISRSVKLFEWIISGKVKVAAPTLFKLSEGKQAHDFMEGRRSTGKILMIPG